VRVLLQEMVLHRPEGVPPETIAGDRLLECVLVRKELTVGLPRAGHGDLVEEGELHARDPFSAGMGPSPLTMKARTNARTCSGRSPSNETAGMTAKDSIIRTIHSAAWR